MCSIWPTRLSRSLEAAENWLSPSAQRLLVLAPQAEHDRRPCRRMDQRVAHQIRQHLTQPIRVANRRQPLAILEGDLAVRCHGLCVGCRLRAELVEIDRHMLCLGYLV